MKAILFAAALVFGGFQAQAACVDGSVRHTPILGDWGQAVGGYTSYCVNGKWQPAAEPSCHEGSTSVDYINDNSEFGGAQAIQVTCVNGKWTSPAYNKKASAPATCSEGARSTEYISTGDEFGGAVAVTVVCHNNKWIRQ